jgi:hypothetical protein
MAMKPLSARLDEMGGTDGAKQKQSAPALDIAPTLTKESLTSAEPLQYELPEVDTSQDVQVASLAGGFVTGVSKMFSKETKAIALKGADAMDEALPKAITAVTENAPIVIPKAKGIPQPKTIEEFQKNLPQAKAEGVPPNILTNLDRIEGPEDFKKAVDALNITSGIQVEKVSFEDLQRIAVERGYGTSFLNEMTDIKAMYGDIAPDIMRLRFASYNNVTAFTELLQKSADNPLDMDVKASLLYHLNLHSAITDTYVSVRSGAARATAAGNIIIPAKSSDEIKALLADPAVDQGLKDLAGKMNQLLEQSQKEGLVDKVSKVGLVMDLWDRTWKNGLLSGLGTHVVNLSSNITFLASSIATRQLAGFVGSGKRAMGMAGEVEMGEAAASVAGLVHSYRDAFRLGWVALKTGTTREMREGLDIASDAGKKIEGQYGVLDARDYGIENELMVKGINGYANFVTLLGGRPIMALDEIFKTVGYRAELYAQGYRNMMQTKRKALADGLSPEDADKAGLDAMGQMLGNPPKEIDALAEDYSHMITFSRALTGNAKKIQEMAQDHLVGRIVLPFVKTPTWILSESTQHSPFAFISKQWKADFKEGGAKRELAMAKMGMGSMIMIGAGSMVADGRMTGGGPGNTQLKKQYSASGWKPYSFVFQSGEWDSEFADWLKGVNMDPSIGTDGKLYVPFRGIDPIAGPLSMVADAVEYARYEDDQDLVGEVILGAGYGLYNYVGQSSFMQSLSSITGAFTQNLDNPKASFRAAIDAFVKQATSYAIEGSPAGIFNSARGMIARTVDPTKRDISADPNLPTGIKGWYEALNAYKSKTPGLSDTLPTGYDMFGEAGYRADPSAPWATTMTGIRYQTSKQREVDKIVIGLGMPLSTPKRSISVGEEGEKVMIKLQPEEYQFLLKSIGQVTMPSIDDSGKPTSVGVQDAIVGIAKTDAFKSADKDVQQGMISDIYNDYVGMAVEQLLEMKPSVSIRAEAAAARLGIKGKYKR